MQEVEGTEDITKLFSICSNAKQNMNGYTKSCEIVWERQLLIWKNVNFKLKSGQSVSDLKRGTASILLVTGRRNVC